jgi:hypothetical protein
MKYYLNLLFFICLFIISCDFDKTKEGIQKMGNEMNLKFSDQSFQTVVSLVELHKIRFGQYPETLDSLKFMGDWDKIHLRDVKYQKVDSGYNLDLVKGPLGKPTKLMYPQSFWKGLGLKKSNLKN